MANDWVRLLNMPKLQNDTLQLLIGTSWKIFTKWNPYKMVDIKVIE